MNSLGDAQDRKTLVVRNDQGKVHMQKRMLLVNLKELYVEF